MPGKLLLIVPVRQGQILQPTLEIVFEVMLSGSHPDLVASVPSQMAAATSVVIDRSVVGNFALSTIQCKCSSGGRNLAIVWDANPRNLPRLDPIHFADFESSLASLQDLDPRVGRAVMTCRLARAS